MTQVEIELTTGEALFGAHIGVQRQVLSMKDGRREGHGCKPEDGFKTHIIGACGEAAFAKFMGVYWTPSINTFKDPDFVIAGVKIDTRARTNHDFELPIRDDDDDDFLFVLLTGFNRRYVLRGGIYARDARRSEWRQNHGGREPAFFVPQAALTFDVINRIRVPR